VSKALSGSWCLVLGASSGIGRAICLGLAEQGVHVAGVHFDTAGRAGEVSALEKEIRGLGVQARLFNANAASRTVRAETVGAIAELTGEAGLRIFVHSLAFGSLLPFLPRAGWEGAITARQLEMTLDVMAHSLVYWTQDLLAAGQLRRGGKV
jgi:enoyl-[acyl-carrier protein] reductase III